MQNYPDQNKSHFTPSPCQLFPFSLLVTATCCFAWTAGTAKSFSSKHTAERVRQPSSSQVFLTACSIFLCSPHSSRNHEGCNLAEPVSQPEATHASLNGHASASEAWALLPTHRIVHSGSGSLGWRTLQWIWSAQLAGPWRNPSVAKAHVHWGFWKSLEQLHKSASLTLRFPSGLDQEECWWNQHIALAEMPKESSCLTPLCSPRGKQRNEDT